MNNSTGPIRNGILTWEGHYGVDWSFNISAAKNTKHVDGIGYSLIDSVDIRIYDSNFILTTSFYNESEDIVVEGNDLQLALQQSTILSTEPLLDIVFRNKIIGTNNLPICSEVFIKNFLVIVSDGKKLDLGSNSIITDIELSTNTNDLQSKNITLFPNPANQSLIIKSNELDIESISILSPVGQQLI